MADRVVDSLVVEIKTRIESLEQGLAAAQDRIDEFTRSSVNASKQQASAAKQASSEQSAAYAATAAATSELL